jgi:hypothetical protein
MASLRNRKLSGRFGFEPRTGDPSTDALFGEEGGRREASDTISPDASLEGIANDMADDMWLGLLSSCWYELFTGVTGFDFDWYFVPYSMSVADVGV